MIKIKICIIKEILHWGGFCQLTIKDVNEYKDFFFSKYSVIFLLLCYFETISCVFGICNNYFHVEHNKLNCCI